MNGQRTTYQPRPSRPPGKSPAERGEEHRMAQQRLKEEAAQRRSAAGTPAGTEPPRPTA